MVKEEMRECMYFVLVESRALRLVPRTEKHQLNAQRGAQSPFVPISGTRKQ